MNLTESLAKCVLLISGVRQRISLFLESINPDEHAFSEHAFTEHGMLNTPNACSQSAKISNHTYRRAELSVKLLRMYAGWELSGGPEGCEHELDASADIEHGRSIMNEPC